MSVYQKAVLATAGEIHLAIGAFDTIAGEMLKAASMDANVLMALSTTLQGVDALRQKFVLAAKALEIIAASADVPAEMRQKLLASMSMDEVRDRYLAALGGNDSA